MASPLVCLALSGETDSAICFLAGKQIAAEGIGCIAPKA
jgi:hypothetical protein